MAWLMDWLMVVREREIKVVAGRDACWRWRMWRMLAVAHVAQVTAGWRWRIRWGNK